LERKKSFDGGKEISFVLKMDFLRVMWCHVEGVIKNNGSRSTTNSILEEKKGNIAEFPKKTRPTQVAEESHKKRELVSKRRKGGGPSIKTDSKQEEVKIGQPRPSHVSSVPQKVCESGNGSPKRLTPCVESGEGGKFL